MPKDAKAKFKRVTINIPFLNIASATWEADETERRAAWSLYVELVTRISVQSLDWGQGIMREALNSLYSLFGTTREILKAAGPGVGASSHSVGGIAIMVLNEKLRPFLSKWHPELQIWEAECDREEKYEKLSIKERERAWPQEPTLRGELAQLRSDLAQYAEALAEIAGVGDR
jgi:hypothetical protein